MKKLTISHTILYSKNWYKRGDLWEDLKKTLECDDYTPFDKGDILGILMTQFQQIGKDRHFTHIDQIVSGISPQECWRSGYFVKGNPISTKDQESLPDYDYEEALARYILSCFFALTFSEFEQTQPDYKNCLLSSRSDIMVELQSF